MCIHFITGPISYLILKQRLTEKDFEILIKQEINNFKLTYAANPYNQDFITSISHGFEVMISVTLFWETLLVTLRGTIIYYSKKKKAAVRKVRIGLEKEIRDLDQKVNHGIASILEMTQLVKLNDQLINMRKEELKGAYVRSRAEWLELGEKSSRFFLNLENRNRVNKSITEILKEDNTIINNQTAILQEVKLFYENLYKENKNIGEAEDINLQPTPLTQLEKELLDSPLTKAEIDTALTQQKNNKSPGLDGYSGEFFKKFRPQLGDFFFACGNDCYTAGALTHSQSQGLITCLPKGGKPRNQLKNWRPISLLNTTYKIISLCITNRLRPILNRVISKEQHGFLQG